MQYIVYEHVAPNNKRYIGITHNATTRRWGTQGQGYKHQPKFYNAIQKYGWENFQHNILFQHLTAQQAGIKEQELIKKYDSINNGYNNDSGGIIHKTHTTETKEKLRQLNLGKNNPAYGKRVSEQTRKKLSDARKGKPHSQEWTNKVAESHKKKVLCITTGIVYTSVGEAAKAAKVSISRMSGVLHGHGKSAGKHPITKEKLEWRFIEDEI